MSTKSPNAANPFLSIEFLYLDLTTCDRCLGTEQNLNRALRLAQPLLAEMGINSQVKRILISSEQEARTYRLLSSPTIRINGRDIAAELLETDCTSCGELCGCDEGVECRIWRWNGKDYTAAPVGMILQEILRNAVAVSAQSGASAPAEKDQRSGYQTPENLRRFFAEKERRQGTAAAYCCSVEEMESCCAPSEKSDCCAPASTSCGCR